ncbi:GNAT family N-acetyltransferase [Alcanivorax sp. ZXX171]|nr:GNAT family N-acetyltransferase [Alcanivorax sp. ZXX171]
MPALPFEIVAFDKHKHARGQFDCGVHSLNHFIQKQVSQDARRNLNRCYAATHSDQPDRLAGYYTLSSHSVEPDNLPDDQANQPYPTIPAALIGRLAICQSFQGQGLGKALVADAIKRLVKLRESLGVSLIIVDPLGEDVVAFYERFGFEEADAGFLYLPMKTAMAAVAKAAVRAEAIGRRRYPGRAISRQLAINLESEFFNNQR